MRYESGVLPSAALLTNNKNRPERYLEWLESRYQAALRLAHIKSRSYTTDKNNAGVIVYRPHQPSETEGLKDTKEALVFLDALVRAAGYMRDHRLVGFRASKRWMFEENLHRQLRRSNAVKDVEQTYGTFIRRKQNELLCLIPEINKAKLQLDSLRTPFKPPAVKEA